MPQKTRKNHHIKQQEISSENTAIEPSIFTTELYGVLFSINDVVSPDSLLQLSGPLSAGQLMELLDYVERLNKEVPLLEETYKEVVGAIEKVYQKLMDNEQH